MEVAAITGHKILQMLKRYARLRAGGLVGAGVGNRRHRAGAGGRGGLFVLVAAMIKPCQRKAAATKN